MQSLMAVAVVSGATVASIGVALLLEAGLLKIILGAVAKATLDEVAREASPRESYRALRTVAH